MILLGHSALIIILTFLGYWVFGRLHLPSPAIMGPLLLIGTVQALGAGLPMPPSLLVACFQIIIGLSIGVRINRGSLDDIKKIWGPSLIIAVYTLVSTGLMTLLILNLTSDYGTALFSAAPGGISEMAVMAMSYQADIPLVSTFQFTRLLVILGTIPLIARLFQSKTPVTEEACPEQIQSPDGFNLKPALYYGIGIAGGIILLLLNFPGGGIIGAMAALGTVNIISGEVCALPKNIFKIALLGIGATIGLEFSPLMVAKIHEMLLPIIAFSIVIVLGNLLIGWLIHWLTRWDAITCILSSSPGGLSQMVVVGEEMGADTVKISILQTVRVLTIIISVPIIAMLIL